MCVWRLKGCWSLLHKRNDMWLDYLFNVTVCTTSVKYIRMVLMSSGWWKRHLLHDNPVQEV